ncbi:lamin tail domain-containing protein [Photobacterium galatheae]|uniref:Uncharacterized protein n=1 Tax=Photobacterium galatheae TaxID=1654360 RepID=A0A066S0C9_9GAMM|nr:lamin tail domain-containing protein [Photobacterium galatheae]KDM93397.1 hypothetical protein EA58_00575 [Photobacterium galatheae]MCM0146977.1 lamin tail domain-containing protein [Photobacterium galatheae]
MTNIYQEIWNADQSGAGVKAILDNEPGDQSTGFVKVNHQLDAQNRDLKVLTEVAIPESKKQTYELCRVLFDNYALAERDEETETPEEREEIHDLVHEMVDTAPMQVAREYVAMTTGTSISRDRWYNTLMEMWFRRFEMGGDPHLSGFEHVVVGEQEKGKVQGYHFWYKYYLDDGFGHLVDGSQEHFPGLQKDRIIYLGSEQSSGQKQYPESVTISYGWNAPDYERNAVRPLTKPIGGFFVGCSVEGLLALGTVRAHIGARAPKTAIINDALYDLKVFRSANNRHIRTFYPMFKGAAQPSDVPTVPHHNGPTVTPTVDGPVRIIAALVNPEGHDPGHESVTILNTSLSKVDLKNWQLVDRNGNAQELNTISLDGGESLRIPLQPNSVQLSNKGGSIRLVMPNGKAVHTVTYSKNQAQSGRTILF